MPRKRNRAPFVSFGADMKDARKALGYTQKSLAEAIGIDPRYLANIENSGALPSLPVFYEIIRLCMLPVDRYFHPEMETVQITKVRERIALKITACPEEYLPIIEGTIDAAIKLKTSENE